MKMFNKGLCAPAARSPRYRSTVTGDLQEGQPLFKVVPDEHIIEQTPSRSAAGALAHRQFLDAAGESITALGIAIAVPIWNVRSAFSG
jgi:hypothetical protein